MIVLDTNILSELMKATPEPGVVRWLKRHPADSLFTTSITQAEILLGLRLLPSGKRREALESAALEMFSQDLAGRILSFGSQAAPFYAKLAVDRRLVGQPISQSDAQIAAIALSVGARLATRNEVDFQNCGLEVLNPWNDPA